jgi:hypothetical protein
MNPASILDFAQKFWDQAQVYLTPTLVLGLLCLGPVVCRIVARRTRALQPWAIKLTSLLAAAGAMAAANLALYQWFRPDFAWCAWLPDTLFALYVMGWLFTPMLHLRAGSADALDVKIEQHRPDGWNALISRWIPSTGEHRVLLTKR